MKRNFLFALLCLFAAFNLSAKDYKVISPDGRIAVTVSVAADLTWSATCNNLETIVSANAGLVLNDGRTLGKSETVKKSRYR